MPLYVEAETTMHGSTVRFSLCEKKANTWLRACFTFLTTSENLCIERLARSSRKDETCTTRRRIFSTIIHTYSNFRFNISVFYLVTLISTIDVLIYRLFIIICDIVLYSFLFVKSYFQILTYRGSFPSAKRLGFFSNIRKNVIF